MKKLIPALALAAVCAGAIPATAAPSVSPSDPLVALNTSKGTIVVQVYKKEVPQTANNFLDLVKRGFYKNMIFHRVVPGFVIQAGDPRGNGTGGFVDPKTGRERTIKREINPNFRHDAPGVLAMARSQDPDSASSQFYITLAPTPDLDNLYAVFGRVVKGMNVVEAIGRNQGDAGQGITPPGGFVKFISAKIVSGGAAKQPVHHAVKKAPVKKHGK